MSAQLQAHGLPGAGDTPTDDTTALLQQHTPDWSLWPLARAL